MFKQGEQLASKLEHGFYRQIDTVSMPISPILNDIDYEEWYKQVAEAIEILLLFTMKKENEGSSYRLELNEDYTFSLSQVGQTIHLKGGMQ